MGYTYKLHPEAEQEHIESYLWYEQQQAGLGDRFANAIRKRLDGILSNPEQYGVKKGHFREVIINKIFPFVIVYVLEENNNVVITSIFHTSRHTRRKYKK